MRILCISNYYPPFFEGGYEISVQESMDFLFWKGHQVFILCGNKGVENPDTYPQPSWEESEPLRALQYIDYKNPSFKNKHQVEKFNFALTISVLNDLKPDLVYFGNMKAISIAPVLAVQKMAYPNVFDIGDIWLDTYFRKGIKAGLYRFLKSALPFTIGGRITLDEVIVVSRWMQEEMQTRYRVKHIYMIPRAIKLPQSNPRQLSRPLKFIFAGRIEPNKGLDICIHAASRIVSEYQDFSVDIYGAEDENYTAKCRALIEKLHLQQHFNFMGKTQNVTQVLPQYDVLLMPTMAKEAFGRIIIEAMAASLIVIATNAYGPREIISSGKDGLLFKRGSTVDLTSAILSLYEMPQDALEKIRKNARATVEQRYEINLVKNKLENILESVLNTDITPKRGR